MMKFREKIGMILLFAAMSAAALVVIISLAVIPEAIAIRLEEANVNFEQMFMVVIGLVLISAIGMLAKGILDDRKAARRKPARRSKRASDESWNSILRSHYGV